MNRRTSTQKITFLAVFAAIIIVQNYVPLLGYIPVGPLEITTIHITVIVAAIVLGPKLGAVIGGVWGVLDFFRAITITSSALGNVVMVNPLVSIVPRILIGLITGWLVNFLLKRKTPLNLSLIISSIIGALINTTLVLSMIYRFFHNGSHLYSAIDIPKLMPYLLTIAGWNGIPEAIAAGIIGPLISLPLLKYSSIGQEHFKQLKND